MYDPIRFAFALLPLAVYFGVLGSLRMRPYPTIVSRSLDILLLGLGCVGIIAIGPLELFFPRAAYSLIGNWVWLVLLSLYLLVLLLVAFNMPPGVVVYGINKDRLREELCRHFEDKQVHHEWLADTFRAPACGLYGQVSSAGSRDISILCAVGQEQNLMEWLKLERAVAQRIQKATLDRSPMGYWCGLASAALFIVSFSMLFQYLDNLSQVMVRVLE